MIGKIGGETAETILKKAIAKEGIEKLAKAWLDQVKWQRSDRLDKDYVIKSTRAAALYGLLFTGKKENWDIIDKFFHLFI